MTKVLVTGATGNVGSQVVRELRGHGASIRALVRDPDRAAEKLGGGIELAAGDFSDTASLRRALAGVEHIFLTSANGPQKVEHETAVIDAATAAGVPLIVKLSTIGAEVGSPLPPFDWHAPSMPGWPLGGVHGGFPSKRGNELARSAQRALNGQTNIMQQEVTR